MESYLIVMISFKTLMALAWAGAVISVAVLMDSFGGE
jgi:hypothetical protein